MFAPARLRAGVRRCGATGAPPVSRSLATAFAAPRYAAGCQVNGGSAGRRLRLPLSPLPIHAPSNILGGAVLRGVDRAVRRGVRF